MNFYAEGPQILGATIEILVAMVTWCPQFMQLWSESCTSATCSWCDNVDVLSVHLA